MLLPYWSGGILIISPSSTVNVSSNTLSDNQVGIWSLAAPTEAWDNTLNGWGYYGLVLDFSPGITSAFGVYASGPYAGTAGANQISDQNVGILVYDDNATVLGNSLSSVNVSIEVATDTSSPSVDNVSSNTANVNVSGALLGDISSFQSGDSATATAAYFVYGNTFVNSSGPTSTSLGSGIAVYGASANLSGNSLTAFPTGISVVVGPPEMSTRPTTPSPRPHRRSPVPDLPLCRQRNGPGELGLRILVDERPGMVAEQPDPRPVCPVPSDLRHLSEHH